MKIPFNKNRGYLTETDDGLIVTSPLYKTPYNALCIEGDYFGQHIGSYNFILTGEELDEHFEIVENFSTIEYVKEQQKFITYITTYRHKNHDYFINVTADLNSNYDEDEIYEDDTYRIEWMYYHNDDMENIQSITESLNDICKENNNHSSKISIVLKTPSGFDFKEQRITPYEVDLELMYNDDFIDINDRIVDVLTNGKKGLVLLHGVPGSGKTSYIKHLTTLIPKKKFVFIPSTMIPYLTDPSFISKLIDNKGSILVLEDCETYIKDREITGDSGIVSTILNVGDGILSDVLEMQIICTFNTHIQNIDKALTREGRLIAEYFFDKLTKDKVKQVMEEYQIEGQPSDMTLAEVFNMGSDQYRKQEQHKQIGFGR